MPASNRNAQPPVPRWRLDGWSPRYPVTEIWIIEPSDGHPTNAFLTREKAGGYLAAISGPFSLAHWKRTGDGSTWALVAP